MVVVVVVVSVVVVLKEYCVSKRLYLLFVIIRISRGCGIRDRAARRARCRGGRSDRSQR